MNGIVSIVGVDPGPTTGLCFLDYRVSTEHQNSELVTVTLLQTPALTADALLEAMLARWYSPANETITGRYAAVEKFVTGRSAGTRGPDADVTRQLVMELTERLQLYAYPVKIRPAAEVKPWATGKRLEHAGITCSGATAMRHSLDAARHALFAAVKDAGMKDPLA
jgi:hypothetical protein